MSLYDTADRRRVKASESMKNGWTMDATAEGKGYEIQVSEAPAPPNDIADEKKIATTLGAELASMIIQARSEFVKAGIPLANPDYVKFIEDQKKPKPIPKKEKKK